MKANEIRSMSVDELNTKLVDLKKDLFMTDKEARKLNVGGEVLAFVW